MAHKNQALCSLDFNIRGSTVYFSNSEGFLSIKIIVGVSVNRDTRRPRADN